MAITEAERQAIKDAVAELERRDEELRKAEVAHQQARERVANLVTPVANRTCGGPEWWRWADLGSFINDEYYTFANHLETSFVRHMILDALDSNVFQFPDKKENAA